MNKSAIKPEICIGIDPGTKTGVAVWNRKTQAFTFIGTLTEFEAKVLIMDYCRENDQIYVVVEDARKRKKVPTDVKRLQGAGAIKRDSKQWQDTLNLLQKSYPGLTYRMVAPNGKTNDLAENKKLSSKNLGITKNTSEHARCAAFLVWKM